LKRHERRSIALGVDTAATGTTDEAEVYLNRVEQKIMAVWKRPPKTDGLKVTLRYNLARNGFVSAVRVEKSSGNQSFDDSAVQAVRRASPFPRHNPDANSLKFSCIRIRTTCRSQRMLQQLSLMRCRHVPFESLSIGLGWG